MLSLLDYLKRLESELPEGPMLSHGICNIVENYIYDDLCNEMGCPPGDKAGRTIEPMLQRLTEVMVQWPNATGHAQYPVPPNREYKLEDDEKRLKASLSAKEVVHFSDMLQCRKAYLEAYSTKTMWDGVYGELRRELLMFCIEYLEEENAVTP